MSGHLLDLIVRNRRLTWTWFWVLVLFGFLSFHTSPVASAMSQGTENLTKAEAYIDEALALAEKGNLKQAQQVFDKFNQQWHVIEGSIQADSQSAYQDIESNMGQVEYAFILNQRSTVVKALEGLKAVDMKYIRGGYHDTNAVQTQKDITLASFIDLLRQTKHDVDMHEQSDALKGIANVRQSWLSVEGTVVAQSSSVYNDTERDMVTVNAMIANQQYADASRLLDQMIGYLSPLASKTGYTVWDAAMIPIREGFEGLLVVAALLAFVNKSGQKRGKAWIWAGVGTGLGLSAILAIVVKLIFSSGAFGQNNFLISGWTGVIAAALLLYMSYWLHSKSNIAEWNSYIREKSQSAINTGRLISLGVVSFLAIFREGTETVLFIIGMVNQISIQNLLMGVLIGLGILAVIAYLMLFVGVKLPIRPFFIVSSLIVFYLCVKFAGMGIHSLQLASVLPSTTSSQLPSIDFLGFYPSWQSAIVQIALVVIAVAVVIMKRIQTRTLRGKTGTAQNG
jgi:high-affinity iron transporter